MTPPAKLPGRAVAITFPVALLVVVVGAFFYVATTFTGDDHLFLAFARYAPNPLVAFVRDQHGGEFYRPLPMMVWWLLGRLAPGTKLPFAALSFGLHLLVSVEVAALVLTVRRGEDPAPAPAPPAEPTPTPTAAGVHVAVFAALLFFAAPATQEAAFWYAASTDLFATAFGVGALLALSRRHAWRAVLLFAAACWSKESALAIPPLAVLILHARPGSPRLRVTVARIAPLLVVAMVFLAARTAVLGGLGTVAQSNEPSATLGGKLLQMAAGLIHLVVGSALSSEPLTWGIGLLAWAAMVITAVRRRRRPRLQSSPCSLITLAPLLWVVVAVVPLLAAPWVVGARYFYLPAIGAAWLAAEALAGLPVPGAVAMVAVVAGLGVGQGWQRRAEIASYEARLSAARRAVADGLAHGANTFHLAAGIKDLDLAVKEDPQFAAHESELLVLGDVPASFVALPPSRAGALAFVLAQPPLPPSGAYTFGARRIVGLARRGDDPTLDEVIAHFPTIRFIRLRLGPQGHVIPRDVTDTLRPHAAED